MAIPVYLFAGFLESGKTSFIAGILQDPSFTVDEHTLIVQCEEGIEEYEPAMLQKTHSVVECIEDEDEYNETTLRAFVRKHHPDRVIVEMNGMWDLDAALSRTPKVLQVYQIITTVNAETFELYAANMGQRMLQHITDADMVIFNRATEKTRKLIRDRNVRSMNPQGALYFENDDASLWAAQDAEYKLVSDDGFSSGTIDLSDLLTNFNDLFGLQARQDGLYLISLGAGPIIPPEPGTGVPEPSTWALMILGAAGLLYWRKRK